MLQFILGRASSGKTLETVKSATKCKEKGTEAVIIVPEQFTFECEKQVLDTVGNDISKSVKVLSFTRICDEIEHQVGGVCGKSLNEFDKLILMKKALKSLENELSVWGKYTRSTGFAKNMVTSVNELKTAAVELSDIENAAQNAGETSLKNKLNDTAKIFDAYSKEVAVSFIDSSDRLNFAYQNLETYRYFENKHIFIDSFDGFTGQQYKIIDRIFAQSKDVTVTLTCSPDEESAVSVNVLKTKDRLTEIAKAHLLEIASDIVLNETHYESEDMAALEEFMFNKNVKKQNLSNVHVFGANTIYEETEFAARTIRKLVRTENARFSDFVIIARDTALYEHQLLSAAKRNGVSCFVDLRTPLSVTPVASTVLAAADLIKGVTSEKIFRFYKSGLKYLTDEELFELEKYTYIWNIDGALWFKEWDMDTRGFTNDDKHSKEEIKVCEIENLRKKAIKPIEVLKGAAKSSAKEIITAIMRLLETVDAKNAFLSLYKEEKENGKDAFADTVRQSWDSVIAIFDSLDVCYKNERVSVAEFYDALSGAISLETIGITPQNLDQVTFGSADRIRPSRPKYAFILGANQGVFPRVPTVSGVFTGSERSALIEMGINIPDKMVFEAINEEYLIYTNVCCPSKEVYISYSINLPNGNTGEKSTFLDDIVETLYPDVIYSEELNPDNLPETPESAFSAFCGYLSNDTDSASKIMGALYGIDGYAERVENTLNFIKKPEFSLNSDLSKQLFGKDIYLSPSKLEKYNACPFEYFCLYGLNVKELQTASFDNMQRGLIVHYILENMVKRYKKNLSKLTETEISDEVDRLIEEYLDGVKGYRTVENEQLKFIVDNISRSVKYVVSFIAKDFAQTDFEPVACEFHIGYEGDMDTISIPINDECSVNLTGYVDRVDKFGDYVRIIDYKTGSRTFKLADALYGLNMQMLIYLYAICKDGKIGNLPAGIFYMPSAQKRDSSLKMDTFMLDDDELVESMDKGNTGTFISKHDGRNKGHFVSFEDFNKIFDFLEKAIKSTGEKILDGKIDVSPLDGDKGACDYCDFKLICKADVKDIKKVPKLTNDEIIEKMESGVENIDKI